MRQITKENIGSVNTSECLYAFVDSTKEIVAMNYIATADDYHFTYQDVVGRGGWSNKIPTELIREMLGWGYEVREFSNEIEYHQWALEQLTGSKWVRKIPSAGDDIRYGPPESIEQKESREITKATKNLSKKKELHDEARKKAAAEGKAIGPTDLETLNKEARKEAAEAMFRCGIPPLNKESQDEIKKLSEEIVTLHEDIVGIRALLDNVRSRLSTLEFTVANHVVDECCPS